MPGRRCGIFAAAALIAAGVASVVLDVVAPGAGPLVQPLSSFAHTGYAWLWRLAVGAGATALVLLAWALRGRATSLAFSAALAGAAVYLGAAAAAGHPPHLFGPWERLALGSALAWSGLLAAGTLRPEDGGAGLAPAPAG